MSLTAIVLRGIFVAAGAATLQQFHQVLLIFAAILAFSSFKVLFAGDDDEEEVIPQICDTRQEELSVLNLDTYFRAN